MPGIKYEISKEIGVISKRSGWEKKLCLVSWNNRPVKFDIREWATEEDENGEIRMGKGITLSYDEMKAMFELLKEELGEE